FHVCQNLGDHLFGNVYVKFVTEEDAEKALTALHGRFYAGHLLQVEYSPVTDFREARCRQYDDNSCDRGRYCNFMHLKELPREIREHLTKVQKTVHRSRSASPRRRRSYGRPKRYEHVRGNSRERREMIARWNKERE